MSEEIKLTQFSHGAGCGCKISPKQLQEILQSNVVMPNDAKLLVGNSTKDDAAVYDLGNDQLLISTTDFFMPIVDDAFAFGCIAATNAISDVYAMGGKPLMAIAILGWPIDKLPTALAQKVLDGARTICNEAGIPLAGGHSIDSTEPIFGLSVNGLVHRKNLKQNDTAKAGNLLLLTKPLGVGILATAEKRAVLEEVHIGLAAKQMMQLNKVGEALGNVEGVCALTDVTGFGLAGHLIEMCEGAGLSADVYWNQLPWITPDLKEYISKRIVPDASFRNWNSYGTQIGFGPGVDVMQAFSLLPDPQTSGGLLIAVAPAALAEVQAILQANDLAAFTQPIGQMKERGEKMLDVQMI
jgi:selenide, water dikinase